MEKLTQWVRRGVCKGARGLRDSPQYINNIIVSGEAILSAENSGKPLGSRTSATNLAEGAHRFKRVGGVGACCSSPRTLPPLSAFGFDFLPLVLPR